MGPRRRRTLEGSRNRVPYDGLRERLDRYAASKRCGCIQPVTFEYAIVKDAGGALGETGSSHLESEIVS